MFGLVGLSLQATLLHVPYSNLLQSWLYYEPECHRSSLGCVNIAFFFIMTWAFSRVPHSLEHIHIWCYDRFSSQTSHIGRRWWPDDLFRYAHHSNVRNGTGKVIYKPGHTTVSRNPGLCLRRVVLVVKIQNVGENYMFYVSSYICYTFK